MMDAPSPGRLQRASRTRSMWLWSGRDMGYPVVRAWLDSVPACFLQARHLTLLILEAAVIELQGPAVLGNYPYDVFRCAVWDVRFDFQGQLYVRSDQSR